MSARWTEFEFAEYLARRCEASKFEYRPPSKISREVKTDYKAQFEQQLTLTGIKFEREFFFALPRKWRSDWLITGTRVLVEFEGGLFAKRAAGHSSVTGILRDIEKYNSAALAGWIVIRITPNYVKSGEALKWVEQAIVLSELGLTNSHEISQES